MYINTSFANKIELYLFANEMLKELYNTTIDKVLFTDKNVRNLKKENLTFIQFYY